jgi:hypothetical protein
MKSAEEAGYMFTIILIVDAGNVMSFENPTPELPLSMMHTFRTPDEARA